jgi:hypothetical protein
MNYIILITIILLILVGDTVVIGIYKHFKNKKVMDAKTTYVAKLNDDGTVDLYAVGTAKTPSFDDVAVVSLFDTNINLSDKQIQLTAAQAQATDLQAQIDAINALPAPTAAAPDTQA